MSYNGYQEKWPLSQTILSWVVLIVFVAFASDRDFWRQLAENHREIRATAIYPGTPEYDAVVAELDGIKNEVERKAKDGTITPQEAAQQQAKVMDICCRKHIAWERWTASIFRTSQWSWVEHWQPSANTPKFVLEDFQKDPSYKQRELECRFSQEFSWAQNEAMQLYPSTRAPLDGAKMWKFCQWLFKWYWLLTFPSGDNPPDQSSLQGRFDQGRIVASAPAVATSLLRRSNRHPVYFGDGHQGYSLSGVVGRVPSDARVLLAKQRGRAGALVAVRRAVNEI